MFDMTNLNFLKREKWQLITAKPSPIRQFLLSKKKRSTCKNIKINMKDQINLAFCKAKNEDFVNNKSLRVKTQFYIFKSLSVNQEKHLLFVCYSVRNHTIYSVWTCVQVKCLSFRTVDGWTSELQQQIIQCAKSDFVCCVECVAFAATVYSVQRCRNQRLFKNVLTSPFAIHVHIVRDIRNIVLGQRPIARLRQNLEICLPLGVPLLFLMRCKYQQVIAAVCIVTFIRRVHLMYLSQGISCLCMLQWLIKQRHIVYKNPKK